MNEQKLSDFHAPAINGVDAQRVLTNEILVNLYQGQIEGNGRGITEKYSNDTSGAEIRTIRQLPLKQQARELGASLNGGNFNGEDVETVATEAVGLKVLTVMDKPIDIAQVTTDMIPVDLLGNTIKSFSGLVNRNINAMTIAGKILKTTTENKDSILSVDLSTKDKVKSAFIEADTHLDYGDVEHSVDVFPEEGRVFVIRPEYKQTLLESAIFTLGDAAQHMFAKGQLSDGDTPTKLENGYIGDVFGKPVHFAARTVWNLSARYLGLPDLEFNTIIGYCSSDFANSRAVAINSLTKVIDNPNGQGIRIQPLIRMGFESWYGAGNVIMTTSDYKDPFAILKSYYTGYKPTMIAPASRNYADTGFDGDTTDIKPVNNRKGGYTGVVNHYAWTTNKALKATVADFDTAYKASGAVKGNTWTSGSAVANKPTAKGTHYLMTLTIASDGTVCVAKSPAITIA